MIKKIVILIKLMWKYARGVFLGKVFSVVFASILVTFNIRYTQVLINDIIAYVQKNNTFQDVLVSGAMLGIVLLMDVALTCINGLLDVRCDKALTNNLEPALIEKFRKLDYFCFEDEESQNIIHRITDQPYLKIKTVFFQSMDMMQIICSLLGLSTIYFNVTIWLVVVLVGILIPMVWVNYKSSTLWWKLYHSQTEDERMLQYINNLLTTKTVLAELKVFRAVKYIEQLWGRKTNKMLKDKMNVLLKVQRFLIGKSILASLWYIVTMASTTIKFFDKSITLGLFVSVIQSTILVVDYSDRMSELLGFVSRDIMETEFYEHFMGFPEIDEIKQEYNFNSVEIVFDDVTFKYPNTDKIILNGVNFRIKPQENIALVGVNGAGKSTIIKLLCKFYKPTSGRILLNGIDLQEISYSSIKKVMGVVFQDYFNYELSIRENVAFGNMENINDDEKLIDVMKKSGVDDILERSTNGLDSALGKLEEYGVDLSGGQWQKLAISRAYLSGTPVIILDEPTAALDPVAESNMYSMFAEVMEKHGTIMISHRLACSKIADRILVLDSGVVVEEGNHDYLMSQGGLYYNMFSSQASWYVEEGKDE